MLYIVKYYAKGFKSSFCIFFCGVARFSLRVSRANITEETASDGLKSLPLWGRLGVSCANILTNGGSIPFYPIPSIQ